ncbi:hypothetical protein [Agromyces silvae]|uniref:hypothetical protein n=1 Tax=Agromyces silvae TaxID=3388266 RepID=UPI00280C22FA|nr:hypothetical protein [Agromyces protaetiae]
MVDSASRESSALVVGAGGFVLGAVAGLLAFWGTAAPISGRGSVGDLVAVGGALVAVTAFLLGRALRRAQAEREPVGARMRPRLHWFDAAALSLAHGIIALLGWAGVASLLSESFIDATVYSVSAAALAGVALAVTAYMAYLSAVNLSPMLFSLVLALFVVVGALASMLSSTDPLWWQKNLSALGISDDVSALAFNLTLIIAGVLVTTIAHYATASLPHATVGELRGRNLARLGIVLIGVLLACVGIFPVDEFLEAHNAAASGMAVVYVATVIGLGWMVPSLPKVFLLLSYVYVAVIVVLAVFFLTGYYNLTAVELVAAALIFSWLIVFLRNTGAVSARAEPPSVVSDVDARAQRSRSSQTR